MSSATHSLPLIPSMSSSRPPASFSEFAENSQVVDGSLGTMLGTCTARVCANMFGVVTIEKCLAHGDDLC